MPPDQPSSSTSHLSRIVSDFEAAGIRPTPLAILSKATDDGLSDAEIGCIVDELADQRGLDGGAA